MPKGVIMRRKDRELKEEQGLEIIDKCVYAVISCVDGEEVFSLPLSVVRYGDSIFIHGAKLGSKARLFVNGAKCQIVAVCDVKVPELSENEFENIKNDSKKLGQMCFTTEYKSVIISTRAYLLQDKEQKLKALRLLSEKYCAKYMSAFETATPSAVMDSMNIYEFKIEKISAKAKIINR